MARYNHAAMLRLLFVVLALLLLLAVLVLALCVPAKFPPSLSGFIGTYTSESGGNGLGIYALNESGGATLAASTPSPSWLTIHPTGQYLYSVNETDPGTVSAFQIGSENQTLSPLNVVASGGASPVYISIDPVDGRHAFVANYGGGTGGIGATVSVLRVDTKDGTLSSEPSDTHAFGPLSHPHMIATDPWTSEFVLSSDLGLDRIYQWVWDRVLGRLTPNPVAAFVSVPGGPRHFVFHGGGGFGRRFVYSIQETASTVCVFSFDAAAGVLSLLQTVSTLPKGFRGTSFGSEIRISGRHVYASNRLYDSIAVFVWSRGGAKLTLTRESWTQGDYPRSFVVSPDDDTLVICNQRSDALWISRLGSAAGLFVAVGSPASVVLV